MHKCKYCEKECKNLNSLRNHERMCKKNENRTKSYFEDWTMEKHLKHSEIMKEKNMNASKIYTDAQRKKRSEFMIEFNKKYWTDDNRDKHSKAMKKCVLNNPSVYSIKNISGRVKMIEINDYNGNCMKVKGTWELAVATYLTNNKIEWTNKIKQPFTYFWNNSWHLYFPDFYLPELNIYIEVKGYERERDRCKWAVVNNLIVLKYNEINKIQNNIFDIKKYIAGWTGVGPSSVS